MDKFSKVLTTKKLEIKEQIPLPNKPRYATFNISFDKFSEFINRFSNIKIQLPLSATIYDEGIISSQEDINLRLNFLILLNKLNFKNVSFKLSDSTMPIYNEIMNRIHWKHFYNTELFMTINRNPKSGKNLKFDIAQGKIMLPEESLIWVPSTVINQLKGKVDDDTLRKTIDLNKIVREFYIRLNSLYHAQYFTEFDKVWLAYDFIIRHIRFAGEATKFENGKQELYNPDHMYDWVSEPLGTFEHKRGVCRGQARLMQVLINNPYFKSDTVAINGTCHLGHHVWVGTVINDRLFETCLTMAGPFKELARVGYVPDNYEVYPRIYETAALSNSQLLQVQEHIKKLKRHKNIQ